MTAQGEQDSGDYRDKFDLKISCRRMDIEGIGSFDCPVHSCAEFAVPICPGAGFLAVLLNGLALCKLLKFIRQLLWTFQCSIGGLDNFP